MEMSAEVTPQADSSDSGSKGASDRSSSTSAQLSEAEELAAKHSALGLVAAAACTPHPAKVKKGGEDAFFFRSSLNGGSIGVADGVGGYSEYGIDPGMFSRTLMLQTAEKDAQDCEESVDPARALQTAQDLTMLPGASTAVVLQLNGTAKAMKFANVGDSGIRVIRDGAIIFASEPLMHSFNCPYQLAYKRLAPNAQTVTSDAQTGEVAVQPGDIIIAASDGVFDNLFDEDLVKIVKTYIGEDNGNTEGSFSIAKSTAEAVASCASSRSMDPEYLSPFAKAKAEQQEGGFFNFRSPIGGKPDDITVVVAKVVQGGVAGAEAEVKQSNQAWEMAKASTLKLLEGSEDIARATQEALGAAESAGVIKAAPPAEKPKKKAEAPVGKQVYAQSQVDAMDKTQLRTALQKLGLPTSGKLAALRQRLLDYRE
eukprot:CAMPEP_0184501674 /NCGR_PEP_ID=MMETSP0113_2-20130426/48280_1 /TAXON_ID=91329 /ORGANISM="Norrisiella sphaerica, Strain BC52" /LENGTH=425 /DNA_ID=CAMNT_0026890511 /DNA_START=387 /DNA_END=1664 /DNA_ORIENTATION=-